MRAKLPKPVPVVLAALLAGVALAETPGVTQAADHNDPIGVQAGYRSGESGGYEVQTGDPSADVTDLFAWYNGPKGNPTSVVLALAWRADPIEAREKSFEPTVAYGIHVDTDDHGLLDVSLSGDGLSVGSRLSTKAEHDIVVWYGPHKTQPGKWGMRVTGIPGVEGEVVGQVGKVLEPAPGVKVTTGLFDDPFFADLDAFFDSISVALGNDPGANPSLPLDRFHRVDPKTQRITRPFGYPVGNDGFGKQNVHAFVVEVPASSFAGRKLHVWGTTERKKGLPKSGRSTHCRYEADTGRYACTQEGGGK